MTKKIIKDALEVDVSALGNLLSDARTYNDPIAEFQLAQRKTLQEEELSKLDAEIENKASVALYFGGKPVIGNKGVLAEFAGSAIELFQDMVSTLFAYTESGLPAEKGPVLNKPISQLMITDVSRGSFGFILNEFSEQTSLEHTPLQAVLDDLVDIIVLTGSKEDEDFDYVSANIDQRTFSKLAGFYKNLDVNGATLRLVDNDQEHSLDATNVYLGRTRTEATEIQEDETVEEIKVLGLLPESLKFEMIWYGEVRTGSLTKEAAYEYEQYHASDAFKVEKLLKVKMHHRTIYSQAKKPKEVFKIIEFINLFED